MTKISLLFKEFTNFTGKILRLSMRNFQGIVFMGTQIYWEIFKSALVHLEVSYNVMNFNTVFSSYF